MDSIEVALIINARPVNPAMYELPATATIGVKYINSIEVFKTFLEKRSNGIINR